MEVYHRGEREIQRRAGDENMARTNGRMISSEIIKGAIPFIERQQMAVFGSVDTQNRVWASVLMGKSGWLKVKEVSSIEVDLRQLVSTPKAILVDHLKHSRQLGALFIELPTRRRYRVNGKVKLIAQGFELVVEEAYPNCPKYIQKGELRLTENVDKPEPRLTKGNQMDTTLLTWIKSVHTFFVASSSESGEIDVSHRGGTPGFIQILPSGVLKIPDYKGNGLYNSLGNMFTNPNAGLLFIDFENGNTLQLTGQTDLLFEETAPDDLARTTGTGRYWFFKTEEWILTKHHHTAEWQLQEYSPMNP